MKVLMIAQHVNFFRNLDTVMRELCARGHEVVFLHGTRLDDPKVQERLAQKRNKKVFLGRGLQVAQSEIPGVTSGYRPEPPEPHCRALGLGRHVMNRAAYMRAGHPSPERVVDGIEKEMPDALVARIKSPLWRSVLRRPAALRIWRWIEQANPPSPTLTALLSEIAPDVALVSPTIWPKDPVEADYLHAARSLGIPTVGYVNSWDNLTSKGTIHVLPDLYIVWNEPIAKEAVELHEVPASIVRLTGAPYLDPFFTMRATVNREQACAEMGCPSDRPYIVYLCSSRTLMASEVDLTNRLAEALARRFPGQTPTIVVRPHPTNSTPWETFAHPNVVIYPQQGDQADSPESWQQYFNQLTHAACVFGLNTTAFLESVVLDRPCLTIVADEFYGAQGRTGHFRHLLEGDFLEVSRTADEVAERVGRIIGGADEKRQGRREFTRWFIRPCGLDRPAAPIVADVLERAALPREGTAPAEGVELVPGLTLASAGIGR